MISLGIESTAHSFGVGVITGKGEVLANAVDMYRPPRGWGIEPMKASEHHKKAAKSLLEKALKEAKLELKDIDIVGFSQGPGLPPCLHAGLELARDLASRYSKPLMGVYHLIAHIEIGKLFTKTRDPIVTFTSGANTQILGFTEGRYRCFGECMDIGIGNALDKFGRGVGLEFPAGPKIENLAKSGKYVELPYVVKGMDLSFSGIITEALQKFKNYQRTGKFDGLKQPRKAVLSSICFSLQETLFAMLTEVTERALAHTGKQEVLLTGGVAANSRLQRMLSTMCKERGAKFSVVPREYSGDCGVNIAWTGILAYRNGQKPLKPERAEILPRQRTDEVEVRWI